MGLCYCHAGELHGPRIATAGRGLPSNAAAQKVVDGGDAGKLAFMQDALRLPHPANHEHEHLPKDLLRVIQFVTGKREDAIAWRQARLALLLECEQAWRPLNARIIASLKPAVRHVVGKYNLAYMACIVNATKFPNVHIVRNFVHGFPVYGQLYTAGCYGTGGKQPEQPVHEVLSPTLNAHWNAKLLLSLFRRGVTRPCEILRQTHTPLCMLCGIPHGCKELEAGRCIGVPLSIGQEVEPNRKWVGFALQTSANSPLGGAC